MKKWRKRRRKVGETKYRRFESERVPALSRGLRGDPDCSRCPHRRRQEETGRQEERAQDSACSPTRFKSTLGSLGERRSSRLKPNLN